MALKNLFDNYKEFEEIINKENEGIIDLEGVELNLTLLLMLEVYCKNNDKNNFYEYKGIVW